MPEVISHQDTHEYVDCGPKLQKFLTPANIGLATAVAARGNNTSAPILSNGYSAFAVGVTSSRAGRVTVQRYLDQGATIPQGAALTATLTAATAAVVNATDGVPFGSFTVNVSNPGTAAATLTNTGVLLQA